jgi:hypothetical protein
MERDAARPSLQLADRLDCEEDERLAALEEDANSEDEAFVVDDLDEEMLRDQEFVPSESSGSDDSDSDVSDPPTDSEDELSDTESEAESESS